MALGHLGLDLRPAFTHASGWTFSLCRGVTDRLRDVIAGVAKLADAPGLGPGPFGDGGSNPLARTLARTAL